MPLGRMPSVRFCSRTSLPSGAAAQPAFHSKHLIETGGKTIGQDPEGFPYYWVTFGW